MKEILDRGLSVVPTREWQDNLSNRLASSASGSRISSFDVSGVPLTQRRRLNTSSNSIPVQPDWKDMYTLEGSGASITASVGSSSLDPSDHDEISHREAVEGMGALSLDEHQEVMPFIVRLRCCLISPGSVSWANQRFVLAC
jgi:hypothetical protein